ncbi:peptide cleavage/export ABC transporter [Lacticaseibacillus pantheris]
MNTLLHLKRYYTPQVDERDCGVAALNMVLKYYHSDYSLAHLRELAKTDLEGTTALGLVRAAEKLDFEVSAVQADLSIFDEPDIPYPFIAHVEKEGGILHYYTVFGARKDKVIIGDPDSTVGLTKMPMEQFATQWSGVALFFAPTPQYQPERKSKNGLSHFIPILLQQRRLIIQIILAAVLITVISITGSYFIQSIVDTYIPMAMLGTLGTIAVGLTVAYGFQSVFTYAENFLLAVLGQRLSIDVTLGYIRHLFGLPMSFFSTRRTGEIVSRFTDASKIIDALASTILSIFLDVWVVLAVGIVLGIQNLQLFALTLVAIPVYIVIIVLFRRPFERMNQDAMESNAKLSSSIIEDLDGIETIKSLTAEESSYIKVDQEFATLLRKSFVYQKTDQLQQVLKQALKLILNVVVLWYGATLVVRNILTVGQLLTFNALLAYFTDPLESIINLQTKLQMAQVANTRLNEVYLVESEFEAQRSVKAVQSINGDIQIDHLSFKYGYGQDILNNISLTIKSGEKLTIVGMSGSGKTTLAKLLVGFYPVKSSDGVIKFNNTDSANIDLHTLRRHIMYVPQEPVILSGSVMDNLYKGCIETPSMETITRACRIAEIYDDIVHLPQQFDTELSESGSILSGGQKQRLAIARALLSPASVFIFDESTSNLDTITERKIVDNLLNLQGKTIIFVAHRLTIAEKTDDIVVMSHGQIVERGQHQELLDRHGYYSRLVRE